MRARADPGLRTEPFRLGDGDEPPGRGPSRRRRRLEGASRLLGLLQYDNQEPQVWFTLDRILRQGPVGREPRAPPVIAEKVPGSLDELARITGKAKSNLSRTLRTMEGYGLVHLDRGDHGRITPKLMHDRVELDLPLPL